MQQPEKFSNNQNWRKNRLVALCELALVLLFFVADFYHLIPFSKTPFLLLLAWISLRGRGAKWREVGMARPRNWATKLAAGVFSGIGIEIFELFVSQPLLVWLTGKPPDLSVFQPLVGNVKLLLFGLALAWTLAAVGEEMVYRGYLMNRVAGLGNGSQTAWAVSLVLVNTLFGGAHLYQGITGVIENSIDGLILGLLYLRFGRSLWVPIIAHGVTDTLDLILIFLGKYPGI